MHCLKTCGIAMIVSSALVACGGSSDSGSNVAADEVTSDSGTVEQDNVEDISNEQNDEPIDEQTDEQDTPVVDDSSGLPEASANAPICGSSIPSDITSIGNSAHVFSASSEQCFGRKEDNVQERRTVPVEASQLSGPELSVEPTGKLVISRFIPDESFISTFGNNAAFGDYLAVDITNPQTSLVCIDGLRVDTFDEQGDVIPISQGGIAVVMGDSYSVSGDDPLDQSSVTYFERCIPAGETRQLFAQFSGSVDLEDGEIFPEHPFVGLTFDTSELDASAVLEPALTIDQVSWTAFENIENPEVYPYDFTVTAVNESDQDITFRLSTILAHYLDDDGFLIHRDQISIGSFLGQDDLDLSPEERTVAAAGGIVGFSTRNILRPGVQITDRTTTSLQGRATQIAIRFSRSLTR